MTSSRIDSVVLVLLGENSNEVLEGLEKVLQISEFLHVHVNAITAKIILNTMHAIIQ